MRISHINRLALTLLLMLLMTAASGCRRNTTDTRDTHSVRGFADHEIVGIDVSAHNGEIDFDKVKADGVKFVYIKATEGGTFKDKRFVENVAKAHKAGLKVGAYHFFRFDTPGYIQGLNFVNSLKDRPLDLPAVIDIEEFTNPNFQATHLVMDRLTEMSDHLESRGYRVMFYTNKKGYARFIKGRLEGHPLWICSLGSLPSDLGCDLWQATHHGRVNGINSDVDINVFVPSSRQWATFASGMRDQ